MIYDYVSMNEIIGYLIEALIIAPMMIAFFFGNLYRRYYEDKIRFRIQGNYSELLKIDQDFLEGDIRNEDEIILAYKKKILKGQRVMYISFIIGVLMVGIFIPIELGWFG
jgi:hypothetical protein